MGTAEGAEWQNHLRKASVVEEGGTAEGGMAERQNGRIADLCSPQLYALCPVHYALCALLSALCSMLYTAPCPLPSALCPMPNALCPITFALP